MGNKWHEPGEAFSAATQPGDAKSENPCDANDAICMPMSLDFLLKRGRKVLSVTCPRQRSLISATLRELMARLLLKFSASFETYKLFQPSCLSVLTASVCHLQQLWG